MMVSTSFFFVNVVNMSLIFLHQNILIFNQIHIHYALMIDKYKTCFPKSGQNFQQQKKKKRIDEHEFSHCKVCKTLVYQIGIGLN